jgi:hypothetical protein
MTTIIPEVQGTTARPGLQGLQGMVEERLRLLEAALEKVEEGFQKGTDILSEMVELEDFQQILSSKLSSLDQDRAELLQLANSDSMPTIMFRWKGTVFSYIVWDL